MNIKQLRYVSAILSTGSFSGAAAYEGVSVQAVSKAMSELEREVGEPLFRRTSSGVIPTPLGEALGPRVDAVLEDFGAPSASSASGERAPRGAWSWASAFRPSRESTRSCRSSGG